MFVPLWVIFLLSGLIMAVFTVVWASRTRQFEDQHRARFIPLSGLTEEDLAHKPLKRYKAEYVGMCTLLTVGLFALGAGFLLALQHM